jgi:hypothetical protein
MDDIDIETDRDIRTIPLETPALRPGAIKQDVKDIVLILNIVLKNNIGIEYIYVSKPNICQRIQL